MKKLWKNEEKLIKNSYSGGRMARRGQCTLGDRAEVTLLCRAFHIFLSTREMYCLANHLMEMYAQSVAAAV